VATEQKTTKAVQFAGQPADGPFSPFPLELVLDVNVSEVEVDGRRLEAVVANVCRSTCGLTSSVIPARLATALTMSWARRVLTGNAFPSAKWCSRSARTRLDIGTTRTLVFLPYGPPLPLTLSWRCCQRTSFEVRPHSSPTRSP